MSKLPQTLQPLQAKKPTLLDLWMDQHFDLPQLAIDAVVSVDIVQDMMNSQPIEQEDAEKILAALSAILHKDLNLGTVYVVLRMQIENMSEVALLMQQIEAENEAGRRALYDLASGVSEHDFMIAKAERQAEQFAELRKKVGDNVAQFVIFGEYKVGTSTSATEV